MWVSTIIKLSTVLKLIELIIFHKISNSSGKNEADNAQLDGLDNDTLLNHFDTLPLHDLIDLADENSRYRELIVTHTAIHRFHIHERLILLKLSGEPESYRKRTELTSDFIEIDDPLTAFAFFRNSGTRSQSLQLSSDILT